jgi:hypothetical protein
MATEEARGSAPLKPLAQSTKPCWGWIWQAVGLCKLSPMASASGGVATEGQPLLRETALGMTRNCK